VKDDESFINFELPKKAHVDWIKFLFYKREETPADEKPMKKFTSKGSKLLNLHIDNILSDQKSIVKAMRARLVELKTMGNWPPSAFAST
jgi:hypothetical protein